MLKMTPDASDYARLDRRAARASFQGTGFVYNSADWGEPAYMAMSALKRHKSFGFGSNPVIEVSSEAVAARLVVLLNAGTAPALQADHDARKGMGFVRAEIARRNKCAARALKAKAAARRALANVATAPTPALRAAAIEKAAKQTRKARKFAETSADAAKSARQCLALLDPNSPESLAVIARREWMRERVAAFRASQAA